MSRNEVQNSVTYRQRNPLRVQANPTSQPLLQAGDAKPTRQRQQAKPKTPTDVTGWLAHLATLAPSERQSKLAQLKRHDKEMHAAVRAVLRQPSAPPVVTPVRTATTSRIGPTDPQPIEMTAAQPITSVNADVADTSVVVAEATPERKPDVTPVPPTMITPKKQKPPQPANLAMMQASAGAMTGHVNGNRAIQPGAARQH